MKLRSVIAAAVLAVSTVALTGCVIASGPPVTVEREVSSDVRAVVLETGGDLVVEVGDEPALTVTAPATVVDRLTFTARDGVLTLGRVPGPWLMFGEIDYRLTVASLEGVHVRGSGDVAADFAGADTVSIRISGAGEVEAEGIDADEVAVVVEGTGDIALSGMRADSLEVRIAGAGHVEADGRATRQSVHIQGSGDYRADRLASRDAVVRIDGAGDVRVEVTGTLDASIFGSGTIRHRGGAEVTSNIQGAGEISTF